MYTLNDVIPISMKAAVGTPPSLPSSVTRDILESKRPTIGEIELTLFENCNIECDFCFHDKKSLVGLSYDEMISKLPLVECHLDKLRGRVSIVQVNMVGGELFQDHWMEEKCEQYFDLLVEIKKLADIRALPLQVVWVSNFLWKKRDVIGRLMDRLIENGVPSSLIASYDLSGRPMSNRYYTNLSAMRQYISTVNLVATKQAIQSLLANNDPFFDTLYQQHALFFDDFIPDKGSEWQLPSDTELLAFYKHIADKYPNIHPIKEMIENDHNEMHCLSLNKITIFPDNRTSNCRWHRYDQGDFVTEFNIHDNAGMMQRFMDENGCLGCKFYARCGFRCYTQWDWKTRDKDLGDCVMRLFFTHLEEQV